MPNITLLPGPASVKTHSGTMPSQQPSTGPCSLLAGQPPRPCCDHSVTPETPSAALLYPSLKHSLLPAQGSATQGQWASLDTTETHSEVQEVICHSCPFPFFPQHGSLTSSSTSCLLLPARSLAAAFLAAQSLDPSHSSSRQAALHKAAWGKRQSGLCCISSMQVGIFPHAFCLYAQS